MKRMFVLYLMLFSSFFIYGQKASLSISFSVTYDNVNVMPDSIKLSNLNSGGDTTLYGSNTSLVLNYTAGMEDVNSEGGGLILSPNYPNPYKGNTQFDIFIPEPGQIDIKVCDIMGRELTKLSADYSRGTHNFLFASGGGLYILYITYKNKTKSIKMYCVGSNASKDYNIYYKGEDNSSRQLKLNESISSFDFTFGDQLSSIVYYQMHSKTTTFIPTQDTLINIYFQSSLPCPGNFTDTRDNNVYSAVQIGSQCWMMQNLAYLPFVSPSSSESATTPYYYVFNYQGTDVNAAKATSFYKTYGVLYNWPAAMAGSSSSNSVPSGVKGVCPAGWHLPSDEEWKILEGEVDSQYGYPDSEWDGTGFRGSDAGGNLKETGTTHWLSPNAFATNSSGFTALPAGGRYGGTFYDLHFYAKLWSSTEYISTRVWFRQLYHSGGKVYRNNLNLKTDGFSVRCLKDN